MVFGTSKFKCSECGCHFEGIAAEYHCCDIIAPCQCPECGSWHTFPYEESFLRKLLKIEKEPKPDILYKSIWKEIDNE